TIRDRAESYYKADVVVTCEPRKRGQLWVEEPLLMVEVLSPSTTATDFERKLPDYRRIASLRHILLVDSERARIHHLTRDGERWVIGDVGPGERLRLDGIGAELDVDELYRDIPLEDPGASGPRS
ncbi:MAG: Uma2 family endonuclease, partial [Geminicoccaceae bacterium]|nr:Uma2 family endonuclease [Geminicoccaceae bacterium]